MTTTCSVFIATSLDGYIARANGDIDWLPADETLGEDHGYTEFIDSVDALVIGRITYELVLTFKEWPYPGKKVFVLSTGLPALPERLSGSVEIVSSTPAELIRRLSGLGIRRAYVDGGKTIQSFLSAGLIDDMTITTIPILIGSGIPLFGRLDRDVKFRHIETRSFKNGLVQSKYRRMEAG